MCCSSADLSCWKCLLLCCSPGKHTDVLAWAAGPESKPFSHPSPYIQPIAHCSATRVLLDMRSTLPCTALASLSPTVTHVSLSHLKVKLLHRSVLAYSIPMQHALEPQELFYERCFAAHPVRNVNDAWKGGQRFVRAHKRVDVIQILSVAVLGQGEGSHSARS